MQLDVEQLEASTGMQLHVAFWTSELCFHFCGFSEATQHNTIQNFLSFQGPVLCFKTEKKKLNFLLQDGLTRETMIRRSHNFLQQKEGNLLLVHDPNQFAKKTVCILVISSVH
jgi:hypothetical protein